MALSTSYMVNARMCRFVFVLGIVIMAEVVSFAAVAPITIRVGYPQPSGAQLPLWVMSEEIGRAHV